MENKRRSFIGKLFSSTAVLLGAGFISKASAGTSAIADDSQKEVGDITFSQQQPLFSSFTKRNGIVYISGVGAHVEPFEIKAHTEIVLKQMEEVLKKAGSSMNKVLKVSVFLDDIADYDGMNEVFRGRFGSKPPVRTTVAVAKGGVPGKSLVEMDCIAYV